MKENWRGANSRLGESVSGLYRAKIRLGEFKAVYRITIAPGSASASGSKCKMLKQMFKS